jgi:hypothetical protein
LTRARDYQICGLVVKRTQPRRGMREVNGIDAGLNSKTKPNLRTPQGFLSSVEIAARAGC